MGGALPFSHGDCPVRSPVSPARRLDGIPGPPGCLPSSSGTSSFSPLPEVLRGGCGVPVSRPVLRALDGPSCVHPRHGSCILDNASSRILSPSILRRLVSPGLHLPETSASEGLSPLAVSLPRHHSESFEELFGPDSDSGLSRDDARDFSFEGFPDPQEGSEVVPTSSGVPIRPPPSCVGLATSPRSDVLFVCHSSRRSSPHAISPASPQCVRSSAPRGGSSVLGQWLPAGSLVVVRRLPSLSRPSSWRGPPRPLPLLRRVRPGLGRCSRRSPPLRLMVSPLLELFDQPAQVIGHSLRGSGFSALPPGLGRGAVLRQLHSPGLPPGARRDSFLLLNTVAQELLRLCESQSVRLLPQFIPGHLNVLADSLSSRSQVIGSEWTLCPQAVEEPLYRWPATMDLFATSLNHRLPVYFSPMYDPQAAGSNTMLQSWDGLQAYAFPPFGLLPRVLAKVPVSRGLELTLVAPFWPQHPLVPGPS